MARRTCSSLFWGFPHWDKPQKSVTLMRNPFPSELRWLVKEVRPLLRWHAASVVCFIAASVLSLSSPLVLKWLIDQVLPGRDFRRLLYAAALIFLSYEGRAVFASLGSYINSYAAQLLALDLRFRLLRHLDILSASYHERTPIGEKLYPVGAPVEEISYFGSDLLPTLLRTLFSTALTLAVMAVLNYRLTLIVLPLIPIFLFARRHFRRRFEQQADSAQKSRMKWAAFLEEHLFSVVEIQLLRRETRRERIGFRHLAGAALAQQHLARAAVVFTVVTNVAIVLAISVIVGYGGWSVLGGTLTVGALVAFYSYLTQLFDPLAAAMELYSRTQRTFASIRTIQALFARSPSLGETSNAVAFPVNGNRELRISSVRFAHDGKGIAIDIPSLVIPSGQRVAILGENGSGKSTLARLVARLYDPDTGQISIGAIDLREIRLENLRREIRYLTEHPVLFDDTLVSNLRLGSPSASTAELAQAARIAGLDEVLERLPKGWEEPLGPNGSRLSGGERQRVAIARALFGKPRILILDEATSCLDPAAEARLLERLDRFLEDTTLILISHRASARAWAERILVMNNGRIEEVNVLMSEEQIKADGKDRCAGDPKF